MNIIDKSTHKVPARTCAIILSNRALLKQFIFKMKAAFFNNDLLRIFSAVTESQLIDLYLNAKPEFFDELPLAMIFLKKFNISLQ